jgi:hypothetical protein
MGQFVDCATHIPLRIPHAIHLIVELYVALATSADDHIAQSSLPNPKGIGEPTFWTGKVQFGEIDRETRHSGILVETCPRSDPGKCPKQFCHSKTKIAV